MYSKPSIEAPLLPLSLHHVGVEITIDGKTKTICVIDTGAAVTVIDRQLATPLTEGFSGLVSISGAGGATLGSLATVSLTFGDSIAIDEIAALSDLEMVHRFFQDDVGGIIGGGILTRFVVDFDLQARRLRLHPESISVPVEAISIPLVKTKKTAIPAIRVEIEGYGEVLLGVDSGAGYGVALIAPEPALLRALPKNRVKVPARGFVGNFEAQLGRGLVIGVGPLRLENQQFLLSRKQKNTTLLELGLAGVIGPQALFGPKSRWILDRQDYKFHVIRDKTPPLQDRVGFIFAHMEGKRIIDGVIPSSPAAEAGIREGDEFLGIVGSDANTRPDLSRALAQPAKTRLELLIRRGEEKVPRTIPVVLREYPS